MLTSQELVFSVIITPGQNNTTSLSVLSVFSTEGTLWAADFETPVGSSTFFSFFSFSWAASAEINNNYSLHTGRFKACCPYSTWEQWAVQSQPTLTDDRACCINVTLKRVICING
jgi:hypothetical protein